MSNSAFSKNLRSPQSILVTGGLGFIGVNFVRYVLQHAPHVKIVIFDKQTYAVNPKTIDHLNRDFSGRFSIIKADICEENICKSSLSQHAIDSIVHFAAESHVDKSITGPGAFIQTNIVGTFSLLQAVRSCYQEGQKIHFHHVSTDEVFGALGETGFFTEETAYQPNSPYSASKAASDHLVRAYHKTYGLNVTLTNCSNNYGPYHFPEKLIPLTISNALAGKPLPIYGEGLQVRDWLYVQDHADAIWTVLQRAPSGEKYNVGGHNEWKNKDVVFLICELLAQELGTQPEQYKQLVTYVKDRPGHDFRYAIDCKKIQEAFAWKPKYSFEDGLRSTLKWYLNNVDWIEAVAH